MTAAGGGTIVNLASITARQPLDQLVHYSAAKAALVNMTKAPAQEFAPAGIRANVVSPAPVATAGTAPVLDFDYPTGRANRPEEVAALVGVLASPRLGNVTGVNYTIDGGLIRTIS